MVYELETCLQLTIVYIHYWTAVLMIVAAYAVLMSLLYYSDTCRQQRISMICMQLMCSTIIYG